MDYLLYGRLESEEPYVFLRSHPPSTKLADSSSVYSIISSLMKNTGVRQQHGVRKSAHCLRHTLAARLLTRKHHYQSSLVYLDTATRMLQKFIYQPTLSI